MKSLLVIALFVGVNDLGLPILSMESNMQEPTYEQCLTDAAEFNKANYPFEINDYVAYCLPTILNEDGSVK